MQRRGHEQPGQYQQASDFFDHVTTRYEVGAPQISANSLDHIVGMSKWRRWHGQPECLGSLSKTPRDYQFSAVRASDCCIAIRPRWQGCARPRPKPVSYTRHSCRRCGTAAGFPGSANNANRPRIFVRCHQVDRKFGDILFEFPHLSVKLAALDRASVAQMRRLGTKAPQVTKYVLQPLPCHKQSYPLATSTAQRDNAGPLYQLSGNPTPDN